MIKFFVPGVLPSTTAQQKGVRIAVNRSTGRAVPMFYKKSKVAAAESMYDIMLSLHAPQIPLVGPVQILIVMVWPPPKKDKSNRFTYKTTKPDFDNASKAIIDSMTRLGYWEDDAQIVRATITKMHGPKPGLYVSYGYFVDEDIAIEFFGELANV